MPNVQNNAHKSSNAKYTILTVVSALTLLGFVVLSSAAQSFQAHGRGSSYMLKQTIWLGIAMCALGICWRIPLTWLRRWVHVIFGVGLLSVLAVLFFGTEVNGAQRWLSLGPLRVQPSEFLKPALVLWLAHMLSAGQRSAYTLKKHFLPPLIGTGLTSALIMLQPDFGTAFLCGMVGVTLIFLSGAPLKYIVPCLVAALAIFATAVYFDPVRFGRITSFLDVEANRQAGSYQLWQALIAFGVGGTSGVGLGQGRQQLAYLPEAHTDFIFPIIGEELGIAFTLAVVVAFSVFCVTVWRKCKYVPGLFEALVVAGATLCIILQALINLGVSTGILPTKGMSLPFISYGGSNLVVMFACVGLILNALGTADKPPIHAAREL